MVMCFLFLLQTGCTELFVIETLDFESVLVVESTISNEMKKQVVKLSRTSSLENPGVNIEKNAIVKVKDGNGNVFSFSQDNETGNYISDEEFQVQANVSYKLEIITQEGKNYTSSEVVLPPVVEMDQLYPELISQDGKEGVQIFVDTHDTTGNAKYFRYEYEEAYKVVVPTPSSYNVEIVNYNAATEEFDIALSPREPEEVCYSLENSTGIIQTATTDLTENKIFRFPVQFIDKNNSVLRDRYSILVKQYVQNLGAYTFYKIIEELGNVESLLSQDQPGYVAGNMQSVSSADEKVLGFFEASSVAEKRIFFNYADFGLEKPPYFVDCEVFKLDYNRISLEIDERSDLYTYLTIFNYQVLFSDHPEYEISSEECSVCTSFSSNVKPDFWED